jgi:uncharacterized phage protein (TIGR02218 family)
MKVFSSEIQSALSSTVTNFAMCWKVTRTDNVVIGFTDSDETITYDGVDYFPNIGFSTSTLQSTDSASVDNADIMAFLDSALILPQDLIAGVWDAAEVEIFAINRESIDANNVVPLKAGRLGEVTVRDDDFTVEFRSYAQLLTRNAGRSVGTECDVIAFGDARCQANAASFTVTGTVTSVISNESVVDTGRTEADGWFNYGTLLWASGSNAGRSQGVLYYTLASKTITFREPAARDIAVGDTYYITAGCDRRFVTCKSKFSNGINFQGFPFVPGRDAAMT